MAFARYFPGADALDLATGVTKDKEDGTAIMKSDKRHFTRLSALASWRSEYILRTRLLRSLARGKPGLVSAAPSKSQSRHSSLASQAAMTYQSGLFYPVSHMHAVFGTGLNKKQPLFMHGAVEQGVASVSDPSVGKVGNWGLGDYEQFRHFADLYVGEAEYGLGSGEMVGMTNVIDLSQPYGKIYGEACPNGRLFFTSVSEQRGRFLNTTSSADHPHGIPKIDMHDSCVTSVWIAKTESVLKTTNGAFGLLAGFSNGVLAGYALGINPVLDRRLEKGEATAKWVICPGVPIIAVSVDDKYSARRNSMHRAWAVVLNALGEVYYLTDSPVQPEFKGKPSKNDVELLAWQTGRSVEWRLIEATRREAKIDPFDIDSVDGSYTPRTSSDSHGLSRDQIVAETKEIEKFVKKLPKDFQKSCEGWNMQRRLLVDFGGHCRGNGGESIFVVTCGVQEEKRAFIRRLTRRKTKTLVDFDLEAYPPLPAAASRPSIFGSPARVLSDVGTTPSPKSTPRSRTSSHDSHSGDTFLSEWLQSDFTLGGLKGVQITALATDNSEIALLSTLEDPLLSMSGGSNVSTPLASPLGTISTAGSASDIPGQRSRFFAAGTDIGVVLVWNMRATLAPAADVVSTVHPMRMIYTKSPKISCLAMTSLYLVHGGNDGLVQTWDPLASSAEPIRTLHSQFSQRARRRLVQAEASVQGVGNNYYAASAVTLDPDSTVLRGMVSLGTHLRYWHYSSTAADAYKSSKRGKLSRRSERGSNAGTNEQRVTQTGRGVLKDYIANEQKELERQRYAKRKENERLSGRYGTGLLGEGATEEQILAYATMLSEEAYTSDEKKRVTHEEDLNHGFASRSGYDQTIAKAHKASDRIDPDVAEAIRLSLLEEHTPPAHPSETSIPIRFAKSKRGTPTRTPAVASRSQQRSSSTNEADDLDFALQLSLAEEQSRLTQDEDFPALSPTSSPGNLSGQEKKGKGKGRAKAHQS